MIGEAPGPTQTLETGLAVAAQLRRLKVFNNCVAHEGIITILPREVTRWVRTRIRDAVNANRNVIDNGMAGPMAISPGFPRKLQNNLAMQQRDIRTQGPF